MDCPICNGTGKQDDRLCVACKGVGTTPMVSPKVKVESAKEDAERNIRKAVKKAKRRDKE